MENFPTFMPVVAAAIGPDAAGRWLMHRRPEGKAHAGLWEFPGGKIDAPEAPRDALVREIAEECGVTLDPAAMIEAGFACEETRAHDGERPVLLLLYECPAWAGKPASLEGGEWSWFTPQEIERLEKPPLDAVLARQLFR